MLYQYVVIFISIEIYYWFCYLVFIIALSNFSAILGLPDLMGMESPDSHIEITNGTLNYE